MTKLICTFTFLISAFCFAQNSISGKIILPKKELKNLVAGKLKVMLKSDFRSTVNIDSTIVDENLNFIFKNVTLDSVNIYFKPGSFPRNVSYKIRLKKEKLKNLKFKYSPICLYSETDSICPKCHNSKKVIPIVYGLYIGSDFHEEKVKLGGCVVSDCDPNWYCKKHKLKF